MLTQLKKAFRSSELFNFNEVCRDDWVRRQAALVPAGSRVLDIGAGSCPYRKHFSGCEYRTQDFTALKGEHLRTGAYGQIDYVCDITAIPVDSASFDVVLCTEVIEHVPDPVAAVREMARVLKPGGRLLLTAPLGSGIHQEPYHYYGGYTPYWYERFLGEAGFEQIEIEANHGFFRFYAQESLRFLRMSSPFGSTLPGWAKLLWLPFWLLLLPLLGLFIPLAAVWLDRFDKLQFFTIGYHVKARRKQDEG